MSVVPTCGPPVWANSFVLAAILASTWLWSRPALAVLPSTAVTRTLRAESAAARVLASWLKSPWLAKLAVLGGVWCAVLLAVCAASNVSTSAKVKPTPWLGLPATGGTVSVPKINPRPPRV